MSSGDPRENLDPTEMLILGDIDVVEGVRELTTTEEAALTYHRELKDEITRLRRERDEWKAIVDRLPKTADGVPILPDMSLWYWDGIPIEVRVTHITTCGWWRVGPRRDGEELLVPECSDDENAPRYVSTRAAAEAARSET